MNILRRLGVLLVVASPALAAEPTPEQLAFFTKEVEPILKANCYKCHGTGEKVRGSLLLTSRKTILEGGDQGPAVSLDKPETSLLLEVLTHRGEFKMPPSGKLPQKEIDVLTKWVKDGVPHTGTGKTIVKMPEGGKVTPESRNYWAYKPVQRPTIPTVKNTTWVRNPIDAFILAKLEEKRLKPAAPADRVALCRRVYYDLTGLPPTPEQVDAFVNDKAPDAYEKLLDTLLDSPHYGEKWGRHWLDLVRYAETHGYERDSPKPFAWRYRDYVISSFNKDKPYDQFIREQLAGDELDTVTPETLIATGYYRLGIWDDEPADRPLAKYDVLDGIVSTTSQVVLGMTVGCARCHDHKRDPIPQRDYYRLLAFFHDIRDMNKDNLRRVVPPQDQRDADRLAKERQEREAKLHHDIYQLEQQFLAAAAKKGIRTGQAATPDLTDLRYRLYRDTWNALPGFDALKAETTGTVEHGFFTLAPATRQEAIGLVFEGKLKVPAAGEYTFYLDSTDGARLVVNGKSVFDKPAKGRQTAEVKTTLAAGLVPVRLDYFNTVGRPSLEVAWSGPGFERRPLSARDDRNVVADLLRQHGDQVLGPEAMKRHTELVKQLDAVRREKPAEMGLSIMCVAEQGRTPTFVLVRGLPSVKGDRVEPGFPEVLTSAAAVPIPDKPDGQSSGKRRILAEWLTRKDNPLTARVLANRLWQHHFGRGIVPTSNDFGKLGEPPTHPELLDWLASEVVAGDWKLKRMHKLIMTSNAYRMSSAGDPKALAIDGGNQLFWRFNMRRLTAEELRDSILAVSGNLNLKMSGPSIYPPIPKEVLAGQSVPGQGWPTTHGDEANRRSVYVHVKRSLQVPILATHDQADTDSSCAVRFTTTVPTQALGMLNGEFTREQAAAFASRIRREVPDDLTAQVKRAIRLTTGRVAKDDEVKKDVAFVRDAMQKHKQSEEQALARYTQMLLNTNEFVYVD
jgi:hypothetical protein